MIILKLRVLSDENDNFVRDYEVDAFMPLVELHEFMIESMEYEPCISSFFSSNQEWERLLEYTLLDMGSTEALSMDGVRVGDLLQEVDDRMVYLYDMFENRGYFITLMDLVKVEDSDSYPRECFAHGTPDDQYNAEAGNSDSSIFEEMMDDFGEFDGEDDLYEDEF